MRTPVFGDGHRIVDNVGSGSGGSSEKGVDNSDESDIIIHKENEEFIFEDQKITNFLLLPGAKHYNEFANVGYSEKDPQRLYDDITSQFDKSKLFEKGVNKYGDIRYNQIMRLGVTRKKNFVVAFIKQGESLKFVTSHMTKGDG